MSMIINEQKYYRTSEVCAIAGIHRSTLYRWLASGIIKMPQRDRRGWRLFSEDNLTQIRNEAFRIIV